MAYADSTYYAETYDGTAVPAGSQSAALERASELIDTATFGRIQDVGLTGLTTNQQTLVKKACCVLADDVYTGGFLQPGVVLAAGFSLGDLSIQQSADLQLIDGVPVSGRAINLLRQTGLMYAGVG